MSDGGGWLNTYVNALPERGWFQFVSKYLVVPYWIWRDGKAPLPGGPRLSPAPSDNVQRMMNLLMPLKDPSPIGRAKAVMALAQNVDEIFSGLDNVGTVHSARFLLVEDYICMLSVYDGDFSNYIRDFIATIGSVFDDLMELVEGGDKLRPCEENIEIFIDWVRAHDLFQAPDFPIDLFGLQDAQKGQAPNDPPHALRSLPRELIVQLHANRNISLGGGYRGYPGYSAAQVRKALGAGW
jgi:hypothetical protein